MPKEIKGNTWRKPPEPSADHSDIDDWFRRHVVFLGGADFDFPPPLGTIDRTRYVKVTTLEETQRPELHRWLEEASRTPGWS